MRFGENRQSFRINPFVLDPTPENLQFLFSFVLALMAVNHFTPTAEDNRELREAIEGLYILEPRHAHTGSTGPGRATQNDALSCSRGSGAGSMVRFSTTAKTASRSRISRRSISRGWTSSIRKSCSRCCFISFSGSARSSMTRHSRPNRNSYGPMKSGVSCE